MYIRYMINRYTNRTWHVCHPFIWSFPVDPCHLFYACNETFSSGAVTSCFSELDWGNVLTDCTTAAPCYGVKFKFFLGYHFNFYNDILVPYMKCLVHTGYLRRSPRVPLLLVFHLSLENFTYIFFCIKIWPVQHHL